jgi:polysaccharide export outer membrane protein
MLSLPLIGDVSLSGLLRAELETELAEYIGRFVRDPRVRARSLIPVTITGAVGQPGFYTLPSELLLNDALMAAGGPTPTAEITRIRIERGDDEIWDEEALREAITAGRTLDQLSMRAGDVVFVPDSGPGMATYQWFQVLGFALAIPATIAGLIAIF